MHFKQLLDITSRFPGWPAYERAMKELRWHSSEFDMESNALVFENFLGASHSLRRPLGKEEMINVWIKEVEPYATVMDCEFLEELDIDKIIKTGEEKFRVGVAIEHMYGALSMVPGVGNTNASKLLHLRLPHLFVMTDADIRFLFKKCRKETFSPYSYAFNFLVFVKADVNEAIDTLCQENQLSRQQAIKFLQNAHGRKRSLAKLMDECYYVLVHNFEEFPVEYFNPLIRR
jgi:hypothetical protein